MLPAQTTADPAAAASPQQVGASLEALANRLSALQLRAQAAAVRAANAATPEEQAALVQEAAAVGFELEATLRAYVAEVELLRLALHPVKARIFAALQSETLKEARSVLAGIEADLLKENAAAGPDGKKLLALARYCHADVLRQLAVQEIRDARDDRDAAETLVRAARKYSEVLEQPDAAVVEVGSSLHGAALRRIVQVHASLYEGYRRMLQLRPNAATFDGKMKEHKKAANQALERLQRVLPSATVEDGRLAVEAARQDVERILR